MTTYPILIASHLPSSDQQQAQALLQQEGYSVSFLDISRLPSASQLKEMTSLGMVLETSFTADPQRKRVKDLAQRARTPYVEGTLRGGKSAQELMLKALARLRPPGSTSTTPGLLDFLESEGLHWCWGWHLAVMQLQNFRHPNVLDRKDFLDFLARQPPEHLPERLRRKTKGVDAPPSGPAPALPPAPKTPLELAEEALKEKTEDYAFLKEEYDLAVTRLQEIHNQNQALTQQIQEANTLNQASQEQIRELSAAAGAREGWVSPEALPALAEKWKKEGAKHAAEKAKPEIEGLKEQVLDLQRDLRAADQAISAQQEKETLLEKRVHELQAELQSARAAKPKAPPPGLKPAATQPSTDFRSALQATKELVREGMLTADEALSRLFNRFLAG